MDVTKSLKDQQIPENHGSYDHLLDKLLPNISLPNQAGNLLKLNRSDTFRKIIYFYSLTGHPDKKLPENWNKISGAKGCTLENCTFRNNYEKFIQLNSIPIGISTQTVEDINEMTSRLQIQYDVLSDSDLKCVSELKLPTFSINNRIFIKKITIIVEKNIIRKVFFPILSINKHINEILIWLKKN
tara:strand:+ start:213 stop:767 length:555 start_codon:yes stop_codon:yes gene_type:complete